MSADDCVSVNRTLLKLTILSLKQSALVVNAAASAMKPEPRKVAMGQVRATADLISMLEDVLS